MTLEMLPVWGGRDAPPLSRWGCAFPVPGTPRLPRRTRQRKEQNLQRLQRKDRRRLHLGAFWMFVLWKKRKRKRKKWKNKLLLRLGPHQKVDLDGQFHEGWHESLLPITSTCKSSGHAQLNFFFWINEDSDCNFSALKCSVFSVLKYQKCFWFSDLKKWPELSLNTYFPTVAHLQGVDNLPLWVVKTWT